MFARLRQLCLALMLAMPLLSYSSAGWADISPAQAASRAKASHGGKVLNVKKVSSANGKTTYRVKLLLENGRVKTVTISG